MSADLLHALSFDVEEFFQVANLRGHFPKRGWDEVPSRHLRFAVAVDEHICELQLHTDFTCVPAQTLICKDFRRNTGT